MSHVQPGVTVPIRRRASLEGVSGGFSLSFYERALAAAKQKPLLRRCRFLPQDELTAQCQHGRPGPDEAVRENERRIAPWSCADEAERAQLLEQLADLLLAADSDRFSPAR